MSLRAIGLGSLTVCDMDPPTIAAPFAPSQMSLNARTEPSAGGLNAKAFDTVHFATVVDVAPWSRGSSSKLGFATRLSSAVLDVVGSDVVDDWDSRPVLAILRVLPAAITVRLDLAMQLVTFWMALLLKNECTELLSRTVV